MMRSPRIDTDFALFAEQDESPNIVSSVIFFGVNMTDSGEFQCHFYGLPLNRMACAVCIVMITVINH